IRNAIEQPFCFIRTFSFNINLMLISAFYWCTEGFGNIATIKHGFSYHGQGNVADLVQVITFQTHIVFKFAVAYELKIAAKYALVKGEGFFAISVKVDVRVYGFHNYVI